MRITDLAKAVAPECAQKIIGIRPGEKLNEILLSEDEARHSLEREDSFVILPEDTSWTTVPWPKPNLPEGFRYSSDLNSSWLTPEQMRAYIAP
jgi:UDP-N-acetylglucosamine 4,6-dehydratase